MRCECVVTWTVRHAKCVSLNHKVGFRAVLAGLRIGLGRSIRKVERKVYLILQQQTNNKLVLVYIIIMRVMIEGNNLRTN